MTFKIAVMLLIPEHLFKRSRDVYRRMINSFKTVKIYGCANR